jgi:hypothetical protein
MNTFLLISLIAGACVVLGGLVYAFAPPPKPPIGRRSKPGEIPD